MGEIKVSDKAKLIAEKEVGNIVTVLPDRAERYFSTSLI